MENEVTRPSPDDRHPLFVTAMVVLAAMALGLVGGAFVALQRPQQVAARLDILVISPPAVLTGTSVPPQVTDRDVTTQVALITSPAVRQRASAGTGRELPPVTAQSGQGSNLVAVTVVDTTRARAVEAVRAYLDSYTGLVADTQRRSLGQQQATATARVAAANASLERLDQALGTATIPTDRERLLAFQSVQRNALVDERRSGLAQQASVDAAIEAAPLTIDRVGAIPEASVEGRSPAQLLALGAVLGLAAAVALRYRRHVDLGR